MARVRRHGATAAATTATTKRSNHPKMRQKKLPKSQATTPSRTLSDMLLSIKPHHLANIISREKESKYAYPILELYELVNPVTLNEMRTRWGMGAPQGPQYVKSDLWEDRWGEDRSGKVNKIY
ncbi:unnamed protein product [Fusarium graminearum]|nr:unnamed protein product [Fusarium graminearum]